MGGLFSDMSKFGIELDDDLEIFEEEKKASPGAAAAAGPVELKEEDFLLDKSVTCPLCDAPFKVKVVKNGKVKQIETDDVLRPVFKEMDANKYNVTVCTVCGYATLNNAFKPLPAAQAKLIKEKISANFNGSVFLTDDPTYSYDMAIERYKLALINSVVKKGKISERANLCLRAGWVVRGKRLSLKPDNPKFKAIEMDCLKQEDEFFKNALDGFVKATMTEDYPMCGMDDATVDFLITNLAVHFKKYDLASKTIARLLTSTTTNRRIKDKCYDLKEQVVAEIKKQKNQ
ncbi:MAG: DUF2225 domain-containing protein [Lachnospiraceae bacterium]|nr:DUF2225 domain-containing protein [Lachnospiraceae bacterium]